jgi:peroxiredoxin
MNLCIDTLEFKNLPEDVVSGFDIFDTRRVVVFGLPGAFTPTCSTKQVPGFDERYQEILELGIDEVYVVSVNDGFVMKAWMEQLGVENLKYLADGSGDFTRRMGMLVKKDNLGFGERSWRYAAVIEDGKNNGITYIDAAVKVITDRGLDYSALKRLLTPSLKQKIEEEAVSLNLIRNKKKGNQLPI